MGFDLPSTARDPADRRRLKATMLSLAAIALLATAALSHQWFMRRATAAHYSLSLEDKYARGGFGLVSYVYCYNGCTQTWNTRVIDELEDAYRASPDEIHASFAFPVLGMLVLGALLAGIGGLAVAILFAVRGKRPRLRAAPTSIAQLALALGLASAVAMTWAKPEVAGTYAWDVGPGWWIFAAGSIIGIVAARMLARQAGDVEIAAARQVRH